MSQQEKQVSFQEYVQTKRSQIVLAYDGAKEIALKNFDDMVNKFAEQLQLVEALKKASSKKIVEPKKDSKSVKKNKQID